MRRTKKDCERITERLADLTGIAFELDWLLGRARLMRPPGRPLQSIARRTLTDREGEHCVSDRLATGEMHEWLVAFEKGIQLGAELQDAADREFFGPPKRGYLSRRLEIELAQRISNHNHNHNRKAKK